VDVPSSEKRGRTTSISKRPDDKMQLQDATTGQKREGPPERTSQSYLYQPTPQNLVVSSLGNIPNVVQGTDSTVTTSGTPTPLQSNVLIPEDYASSQPPPPYVSKETHGTENVLSSTVFTGTNVPSGEKSLLTGKGCFLFAFPPALTLRLRYFARILSGLPLH